jgi:hypothetical protein
MQLAPAWVSARVSSNVELMETGKSPLEDEREDRERSCEVYQKPFSC